MSSLRTSVETLFDIRHPQRYQAQPANPVSQDEESGGNPGLYVSTGVQDMRLEEGRSGPMSEKLSFKKPGITTAVEYSSQEEYAQILASSPINPNPTRGPQQVINNLKNLQEAYDELTENYEHDVTRNRGHGDEEIMQVTFTGFSVRNQDHLDEVVQHVFEAGSFPHLKEDYQ